FVHVQAGSCRNVAGAPRLVDSSRDAEFQVLLVILFDAFGELVRVGGAALLLLYRFRAHLHRLLDDAFARADFDELDRRTGTKPDVSHWRAKKRIELEEVLPEQMCDADGRERDIAGVFLWIETEKRIREIGARDVDRLSKAGPCGGTRRLIENALD